MLVKGATCGIYNHHKYINIEQVSYFNTFETQLCLILNDHLLVIIIIILSATAVTVIFAMVSIFEIITSTSFCRR